MCASHSFFGIFRLLARCRERRKESGLDGKIYFKEAALEVMEYNYKLKRSIIEATSLSPYHTAYSFV